MAVSLKMAVFWYVTSCSLVIDVPEVLAASLIVLMIKAGGTFKTSVNFYQITRRNVPKDSHLYT
jgi:hypothetical protein